jgi:membrane-bound lytic murein transglycosylase A
MRLKHAICGHSVAQRPVRLAGLAGRRNRRRLIAPCGVAARRMVTLALSAVALASCGGSIPATQVTPPPATLPAASTALTAGLAAGPQVSSLNMGKDDARGALELVPRTSCPRLVTRTANSGLTTPRGLEAGLRCRCQMARCRSAAVLCDLVRSGQGGPMARRSSTGYYEPVIAGVRIRQPGFDVPVYACPQTWCGQERVRPQPLPTAQCRSAAMTEMASFVPYFDARRNR